MLDISGRKFERARARLREAVTWQKKALAAYPGHPDYRQFLTHHLTNLVAAARGLGRADEAAAARRELDELKAADPRFAALDGRLAAVARGEAPGDNRERLALAQRAYDTSRHTLAARLWAEALEAEPKLADDRRAGHRYNAACAAALAAAVNSKDDPRPDAPARAALRRQALGWLGAELAVWTKLLEGAKPEQRAAIARVLAHWQEDPDLAGVRDAKAVDALPVSERDAWRALWKDVAAALARARGGP